VNKKINKIKEIKDFFYQKYLKCTLCPRKCKINRFTNEGFCRLKGAKIAVSSICKHFGEEPPISGNYGSGTVFFSNCNMSCIYCQNIEISNNNKINTKFYSYEELAKEFLKLQNLKCHNINLVSPTPHIAQIIFSLELAFEMGLNIPIVYNTNLYEDIDVLNKLKGIIDIYLPDFKYSNNAISYKYSSTLDYFEIAKKNIKELFTQTRGALFFDNNNIALKGLIVRHLILPNNYENSKTVLEYLAKKISSNIYLSLMSQYKPNKMAIKYGEPLNRSLNLEEYESLKFYATELGFINGWFQDLSSKDIYNPDFKKKHPFKI